MGINQRSFQSGIPAGQPAPDLTKRLFRPCNACHESLCSLQFLSESVFQFLYHVVHDLREQDLQFEHPEGTA